MGEKNDPMLLIDRRFLMDFLTDETDEAQPVFEPEAMNCITFEELSAYAGRYAQHSAALGKKFFRIGEKLLTAVTTEHFVLWADAGIRLFDSKPNDRVAECFLEAGPCLLNSNASAYLKGWLDKGERILGYCTHSASMFYHFTPLFLQHSDIHHIGKWADWGIEILNTAPEDNRSAALFFETSIDHLKYMTFRELQEWKKLGLEFLRKSPLLAMRYFRDPIEGFSSLNWPERNILYRLTSSLIKVAPEKALTFVLRSSSRLAEASPNTRDTILTLVEKLTEPHPQNIAKDFDLLMNALQNRPYPSRETILGESGRLVDFSVDAARAFIRHIPDVLTQIPVEFLGRFTEFALSRINTGYDLVSYFSLSSTDAIVQMERWKNAVLLEDYSQILSIFAQALTGHTLHVKKSSKQDSLRESGIYPFTDGKTIFLPPYIADGTTPIENFNCYKAATAHQAGYLEFESFKNGLNPMLHIFECLPDKELVRDIFLILEDGRIDWMLTSNYPGLTEDLREAVSRGLKGRTPLEKLPLWSSLTEMLLRMTLSGMGLNDIEFSPPASLGRHVDFLQQALTGFYQKATTIRHCFLKTFEIYRYIRRLPNTPPLSCEPFKRTDANAERHVYQKMQPLLYRGMANPSKPYEPVSLNAEKMEAANEETGAPLSPEEIKKLLDGMDPLEILKVVEDKIKSSQGLQLADRSDIPFSKSPQESDFHPDASTAPDRLLRHNSDSVDGPFYYDEWDFLQGAYRKKWCRLSEKTVQGTRSALIEDIYRDHADLIRRVRRQFQQIRPQNLDVVPRVEWGDEIDLPSAIQVVVDKRSGSQPTDKIFIRKEKKIRKIAVLLLIDMSASTGNPASSLKEGERINTSCPSASESAKEGKKIIDIEIESLVVLAEALEALNDEYAIYGFSGFGRKKVDFYRIKDFEDVYSDELKERIAGIAPKQSTRMGPAIRHAAEKMAALENSQRLLVLLSDGFPQDSDYGEDRSSHEYGLHDTMMALLEAKNHGVQPFCITVDQGGSDYLKKMCDPRNYLVIRDIFSLPEVLPKVVESLIEG
ncbi:MAG: hypothetical protein R6U50_17650 [Desulfobacterales bacterium]